MATDKVIRVAESGNNTNGSYVKFPDGTMLCWGSKSISLNTSGKASESFTFPKAFNDSLPIVNVTGFASGADNATGELRIDQASSSGFNCYVNSPQQPSWGHRIYWMAIGRWK